MMITVTINRRSRFPRAHLWDKQKWHQECLFANQEWYPQGQQIQSHWHEWYKKER